MSGHLMVEVVKAENLNAKDSWPFSSDPYVVIEFSSGVNLVEYQTEHRSNTLNPSFQMKFQFKATKECDKIALKLYDYDMMGDHEYMGEASIWLGSQSKDAQIGYVEADEPEDDEGEEGEPAEPSEEQKREQKRLAKMEAMRQPGVYRHTPAGTDHDGLTIPLLEYREGDKSWQPAGTITIKWVYSYSSFGGLFAAKVEEISMAEKKAEVEVKMPDFDLDVLKGNIKRIGDRVGELLAPFAYIGDVLNWQNPPESFMWMMINLWLLKHNMILSALPLGMAMGMLKNWYTYWRWGPAGPPIQKWEMPIEDLNASHKKEAEETIEHDGKEGGPLATLKELQKLGAQAQMGTAEALAALDLISDILNWKRPLEAAGLTAGLLVLALILAIPYLFTAIYMIVTPFIPWVVYIVLIYLFTLFPLYNQFPYLKKYYQIDDVIELLIFAVVQQIKGLPIKMSYNTARKKALAHLTKSISPELLELIDRLDATHMDPTTAANDILSILRNKLFHPEARKAKTIKQRQKDEIVPVQRHEQLIVYNIFRRQYGSDHPHVEFFIEKECDADLSPPVYKLRRSLEKTSAKDFNPQLATAFSDAIKAELIYRSPGGEERTVDNKDILMGDSLWIPRVAATELHDTRLAFIHLEIERAKEIQKKERIRKYGDKIPKRPRLTVNILNCRGLVAKEKGKRAQAGRVTFVKVTLSKFSMVTDKKKHSTAPQFRSQCKFGFDSDGHDAFDPRVTPYLRVELFEADSKQPFGQLEIDIRKLPRREETAERYFPLKRRGNEIVGEIALTFFCEAFGVEHIRFNREVAGRLGADKVLQRMYMQAIKGGDPSASEKEKAKQEKIRVGRLHTLPKECTLLVGYQHINDKDIKKLHPDLAQEEKTEKMKKDDETKSQCSDDTRDGASAMDASYRGLGDRRRSSVELGGPSPYWGSSVSLKGPPGTSPKMRGMTGMPGMMGQDGTASELRDEVGMLRRTIEDLKMLAQDDDRRIRELHQQQVGGGPLDGAGVGDDASSVSVTDSRPNSQQQQIYSGSPRHADGGSPAARPASPRRVPPPRPGSPREMETAGPAAVSGGSGRQVGASAPAPEFGTGGGQASGGEDASVGEMAGHVAASSPQRDRGAKGAAPLASPPAGSSGGRRGPGLGFEPERRVSSDVYRELDRVARGDGAGSPGASATGGAVPPRRSSPHARGRAAAGRSSPTRPRSPARAPSPGRNAGAESSRASGATGGEEGMTAHFYCDGCSTTDNPIYISGVRWNCIDAPDYDLCNACFKYCAEMQLLNRASFRSVTLDTREEAAGRRPADTPQVSDAKARLCEARLRQDPAGEARWAQTLRELMQPHGGIPARSAPVPLGFDGGELSSAERNATRRSYQKSASSRGYADPTDSYDPYSKHGGRDSAYSGSGGRRY